MTVFSVEKKGCSALHVALFLNHAEGAQVWGFCFGVFLIEMRLGAEEQLSVFQRKLGI